MRRRALSFPELALIAGTRGMLGFGAALLLAERFSQRQRQRIGWALLLTGALSTIPILAYVLRKPTFAAPVARTREADPRTQFVPTGL